MRLREVIVDRAVLNGLRRRALRAYPREIFEQIVGQVRATNDPLGDEAHVFMFRPLECTATKQAIFVDDDMDPMNDGREDTHLDILGTIHSHPQDTVDPSPTDWKSMRKDGELIMGICAVRMSRKRRFTTLAFWTKGRKLLPWTVGESR